MRLRCRLREYRQQQGLPLRAMQDLTGIHRGTLSQLENGRRLPREREIPVLEQAYGAPVDLWYRRPETLAVEFEADT